MAEMLAVLGSLLLRPQSLNRKLPGMAGGSIVRIYSVLGRKGEGVARDEVGDNDLTRMPKVANVNEQIVNPERSFGSNIMEQVSSTF